MRSAADGIRWADDGAVRVITLDRPPVNALNWPTKRALRAAIDDLANEPRIRCVVFHSALERTFCAGSDLHELARDHRGEGAAAERTRFEFEMWQRLSSIPQVSIAAVEGFALGSGFELCVACDFRVVGADAVFGLPEITIGGGPGAQTLARLGSIVGHRAAKRMLLLAARLDAKEADAVGLADQVVAVGDALPSAVRLAHDLARRPASSVRYLRDALLATAAPVVDAVEPVVMREVTRLFLAPEMREGIAAFLEKREPDFPTASRRGLAARPE